jgi:hypothetical protein
MNLRLENKPSSILRIEVGIWIPKIQRFVKSIVIFDTGAYKTIIDEGLATILELPVTLKDGISIVTATGISTTHCSILPCMLLGKTPIKDIPVNVMRLPKELKTRCILGMNVLQEFDIHINNFDKIITLTSKPLPKKYFKEDYSVTLTTTEDGGIFEDSTALKLQAQLKR